MFALDTTVERSKKIGTENEWDTFTSVLCSKCDSFGENIYKKVIIIRKIAKVLFDCTKEVHVEDNTEKTNLYVYVCSLECRTVITTTN